MKKITTLSVIIFAISMQLLHAQNTYPWPSTGNVGLGVTSPSYRLHLDSDGEIAIGNPDGVPADASGLSKYVLRFRNSSNYYIKVGMAPGSYELQVTNGNYGDLVGVRANLFKGNYLYSLGNYTDAQMLNGSMQIGGFANYYATPLIVKQFLDAAPYKPALEVNSNLSSFNPAIPNLVAMGIHISPVQTTSNATTGLTFGSHYFPGYAASGIYSTSFDGVGSCMRFATTDNLYAGAKVRMTISAAGGLGIGTLTPDVNAKLDVAGNIFSSGKIAIGTTDLTKIGSYSLAVNGDAIFNKVKVKLYNTWPDYVFEDDYGLPRLEDVEQFIKANNHLPGVPSAEETSKNGLDLEESQAVLLKKVEELTLYMIEMTKQVVNLKKDNEILKKENSEIKQKLDLAKK